MRVRSWDGDEPYPNAGYLFGANVGRALQGKTGQKLLREIEEALLAMPEKKLWAYVVCEAGRVCTLGAVAVERAIKAGKSREEALSDLEKEAKTLDHGDDVDKTFKYLKDLIGIKQHCLAWQIVFENDEMYCKTPEERYAKMLNWIHGNIIKEV
jgi:hypothetical protein